MRDSNAVLEIARGRWLQAEEARQSYLAGN
jgi:hypothetical protein